MDGPAPPRPQPELDFDGRYRVERVHGAWHLLGPAFPTGMRVCNADATAESSDLLAKYRDVADLMNAAVEAERHRAGRHP